MTQASDDDRSPAPAVTRAAAVLRLLAAEGPSGLTDIARTLALAKSSTLNLLVALEAAGLVRKDGADYRLGRATVELGAAYVRQFDVVREFARACDEHPVLAPELMHLAVLHGTDVLYLARHDGEHPWRMSAMVGDRFPASITAVGNALLASLDDDEVRARYTDPSDLPVWTQHSVATVDDLLAKLHRVRAAGVAVDDRETNPGIHGIAVLLPARRPSDAPMALGVSLVHHASSPSHVDAVTAALVSVRDELAAAGGLARAAGGSPGGNPPGPLVS